MVAEGDFVVAIMLKTQLYLRRTILLLHICYVIPAHGASGYPFIVLGFP